MPLYAATIFVSAFLLFLVQPVMAKQILPWFGGSAAVWTTCLVFFQTALLAGYAYSDALVHRVGVRAQWKIHAALLALSLALLPIVPAAHWKPAGTENPSWRILGMLAVTIGLPYFLLSTTSPLVQAWFARTRPGASPYRLFALSNFASMLALVGYPFLLEPWTATRAQARDWSAAYVVFVALCVAAGWASARRARAPSIVALAPSSQTQARDEDARPALARHVLWCALAATGSMLLLAVTNHVTVNVAAVPLLWIAPLAVYLLTFILCFDTKGWYRAETFRAMAAAALGVMAWTLADSALTHEFALQLGVFLGGLFLACMFCHGELAAMKPSPRHLTRFYLMVSLGGAVGAVAVGIVAPLVLPAHFELAGALVVCALLLVWQVRREHVAYGVLAIVAAMVALGCGIWGITEFYDNTVFATRNFYGVLRVQAYGTPGTASQRLSLVHGTILHGTQYQAAALRNEPTTYYTRTSGIGRAIESLHPTLTPVRVGVIGLGTGTIAVYGSTGDVYRFYEINPAVVDIAKRDFTYLSASDATIEIVLGDARLSLEREPPQQFDVLAVDAFSSDAIPVHLITKEAVGVYLRHVKPNGIVAFHVTNRYLQLAPVVEALARAHGLAGVLVADGGEESLGSSSDWVLLARDAASLQRPTIAEGAQPMPSRPDWRLWTDDFNNLVQVLKR